VHSAAKYNQELSKESYGSIKRSNIPKIGPTPAIKLESGVFLLIHWNKIYAICMGVGWGSSIDIWFKYTFNKFTVKYIP
jgi:hypothetical protein